MSAPVQVMTIARRPASTIVLSLLLLPPLAACGPVAGGATTPAAPAATGSPGLSAPKPALPKAKPAPPKTNPAPANPAPANPAPAKPAPPKAKPKSGTQVKSTPAKTRTRPPRARHPGTTARDPLFGIQYAYFKSADVGNRRITFDLVEWYEGKAAAKACRADGERPAENDWCTGWYLRNRSGRLRTLTVYPDARLRVSGAGPEMTATDLKGFVAALRGNRLFSFDVDANRIMAAHQVHTP